MSIRVLIVEDSEPDTDRLVAELRRGGYDVTWQRVQSAWSTRQALESRNWDIVIADYNLPRFSGLEALELVQERLPALPVVIVSGAVDEDVAVAALHMGATDYVMKRNLSRLVPAVERALRDAAERLRRYQAEEALRVSEERYRELFENANDVIFTIDLEGNFTSINRAGEAISGYSRDQVRGLNMSSVLTAEGYERALQMRQAKLSAQAPTRYELELIARDGRLVPLELSTRLIVENGVPVGVQGIARDITDRRRAEAELRSREHKQAVVASLGQRAVATTNLDALFDAAAESIAGTLDLEYCSVLELLPDGSRLFGRAGVGWKEGVIGHATVEAGPGSQAGYTLQSVAPVIVEDVSTETRFRVPPILRDHDVTSGLSVIIEGPACPFGVLSAFSRRRRVFTKDDLLFLQAVANILAASIERTRLERERERHAQELAARVLEAQEAERKRIARELHDETAQTLSVLLANLDLLRQRIAADDRELHAGFVRVETLAKRALDETRALSHDLRPTILDDVGLVAALRWLAVEYENTYGTTAEVDVVGGAPAVLSAEMQVALFRIAQEALTNCGKHASAGSVRLALSFPSDRARLTVEDDGRGFRPDRVRQPSREGRLGLYGMRERAALLGGTLDVISQPGRGTSIVAEVPLGAVPGSAVEAVQAGIVG